MSKNELVIVGKYNLYIWVNREREKVCVCIYFQNAKTIRE